MSALLQCLGVIPRAPPCPAIRIFAQQRIGHLCQSLTERQAIFVGMTRRGMTHDPQIAEADQEGV